MIFRRLQRLPVPSDPTYLGSVEGVSGPTVTIKLHSDTASGLSFVRGYGYRVGQVGSFVKIPMGYSDLFGIVTTVGAGAVPENLAKAEPYGHRWLTVQLIGEGTRTGDFQRGISQFPTVGDSAHLVIHNDLERIYGRPKDGKYLPVGHIASADSIPALIDINKLVTRHCAVLGSTGAGKSTTVAALIGMLSSGTKYPSARILLVDIHGEYAKAFQGRAAIYRINPNATRTERPLNIPYWALTFEELIELTFGVLGDNERGAVRERIVELKRKGVGTIPGLTEENLTVDSPVPFSIHQLWFDFHKSVYATYTAQGTAQNETTTSYEPDAKGGLEKGDAIRVIPPRYTPHTQAAGAIKIYQPYIVLNMKRPVDVLGSKLRDKRLNFLFRPGPWTPNADGVPDQDLDTWVKGWLGDTPVTILDLSGVPSTILNTLIGALLRIVYDCMFWGRNVSEGARERPLLVVLEEAHSYLAQNTGERASDAVKRIVKEGRKYGIGAMIVSQRPSEIDSTILSQCGTMFALRLSNSSDRGHVTSAVTDNLEGLLAALPSLRTGEAIIIGEAVHLPMRTILQPPPMDQRPDSGDPLVFSRDDEPGGWNSRIPASDYADLIKLWRNQDIRSEKVK